MSLKLAGYIARTKGLKGDLLVNVMDIGKSKINSGDNIFLGFSENFSEKYKCSNWKQDGKNYILHLENINTIELAEKFKEFGVYIEETLIDINDDDVDLNYDIIGYEVINNSDKSILGSVKELLTMPANDVLIVKSENGELPIPYIREFIPRISPKFKKIYVNVIDGLMDLMKK